MRVSIKAINGVDTVDVSLKKGLATVTMKPGNAVNIKQLQDAIAKNGFTMKQTEVVIRGVLESVGGKFRLKVSGTSDVLDVGTAVAGVDLASNVGKPVEVTGTMPEGAKGKAPNILLEPRDILAFRPKGDVPICQEGTVPAVKTDRFVVARSVIAGAPGDKGRCRSHSWQLA